MAERFSTPKERVDRATRHRAASPDHASCERRELRSKGDSYDCAPSARQLDTVLKMPSWRAEGIRLIGLINFDSN